MPSTQAQAQALRLIDVHRYADAKKILTQALGADVENDYLYQLLALCELHLGKQPAAQRAIDQCLSLNPENQYGHYLQSVLDYDRERWDASEAAIRRALELDPGDPDFYAQLASIQLAAGKTDEAGDAIRAGLNYDPNHVDLLRMKTNYHYRNIDNHEAQASLDEALANDPQNPGLLTWHGNRLLHQNRVREARQAFADALAIDPTLEEARMGLAESYKVQWWIFRIFYQYGFSRWKLELSWQQVILYIILIKTVFIWGILFILFLLFTWWGDVLFNTCLRLGRRSQYLLSEQKIRQSNFFLAANIAVLGIVLAAQHFDTPLWWKLAILGGLAVFVGIAFLEVQFRRQRWSVGIAGGSALLILAIFSGAGLSAFVLTAMALLLVFGALFSFRAIGW